MENDDWTLRLPTFFQESPIFCMKQVIRNYEKKIHNMLVDFGLTFTQIQLLVALSVLKEEGKTVSQRDVVNLTHCDKNTVSAVLRTLEKKGYIERYTSSVDKREKNILITDEGLNLIKKAFNEAMIVDNQFFVGNDRDELIQLLKKYV